MKKRILFSVVFILTLPLILLAGLIIVFIMMPISGVIWVIKGDEFDYDKFIFLPGQWLCELPYKMSGIEE